jgi:hypothetical protein
LLVSEPDNEEYLQMATALDEVRLAGIGFRSLGRSTARPVAPERGTHDGNCGSGVTDPTLGRSVWRRELDHSRMGSDRWCS